jgi:predicted metalloprotease
VRRFVAVTGVALAMTFAGCDSGGGGGTPFSGFGTREPAVSAGPSAEPTAGDNPSDDPTVNPSVDVNASETPLNASPTPLDTQEEREQKVLEDAGALRDLLDEFWTAELQRQFGIDYDPPDRFEWYRGDGNSSCGSNNEALPENAYYCFIDSDEYVAFDLDWFTSYLGAHPGGATTFLILAHEWGHSVQDAWLEAGGTDSWDPAYLQELQADCLAGVFLADAIKSGTVIEEEGDADAIFGWLFESGAGTWTNPSNHGTSEQRQQAFSTGYEQGSAKCRSTY